MSLADIPPEMLPFIPALPPPNGTESNFIDPENRANQFIAIAGVFLGLATLSVILRLYVRCIIQKSAWWDDLAAVVALLCQATYTGLNVWLCQHGVGKHMWDVRLIEVLTLITPARVMADITEPSIGFTKLTLLLLYYRLFSPDVTVKMAILFGIVFITVCYTTLMFLFIFLSATRTTAVNKAMAVINVLTDCYILVLPLYSVLKLFMPTRKKIGLSLVFASGIFAVAMSIAGAVLRFRFADDGADFTWGLLNVILVNQIECCIGIMCACMPLFPALLKKAHLISNSWIISMRSLRYRIFPSQGGSGGSGGPNINKSTDHDDFVRLKAPSGSSLKNLQHPQHVTKVHTEPYGCNRTVHNGIEVTTDFAIGRA